MTNHARFFERCDDGRSYVTDTKDSRYLSFFTQGLFNQLIASSDHVSSV